MTSFRLLPKTPTAPRPRLVIVLDTETSGLPECPSFGTFFPPSHLRAYEGSRMIELAWQAYDPETSEPRGKERSMLVRPELPDTFRMHPRAFELHKISKKMLDNSAHSTRSALHRLAETMRGSSVELVGHNIAFDWHVLVSESLRVGCHAATRQLMHATLRCTMHENTARCGLVRMCGSPKWPTLRELVTHVLGEEEAEKFGDRSHRALQDVQATARCFFATREGERERERELA